MTSTHASDAASRQSALWSARARDWAELEERSIQVFRQAIDRLDIRPGQLVLDVGCGSGVFARLAADAGASVFGLDASETLIDIARKRVPEAELRVGDLQFLPYADDMFDLVTGFNSFFFAADMTEALREAGRVARPGAPVLMQVWGRPERCDLTPALRAIRALRAAPPVGTPAHTPLWTPGVLERIASDAGLTPSTSFVLDAPLELPDERTLVRLLLAPAASVEAIEATGEQAVATAVAEAMAPQRRPDGSYCLHNEWHYALASA